MDVFYRHFSRCEVHADYSCRHQEGILYMQAKQRYLNSNPLTLLASLEPAMQI